MRTQAYDQSQRLSAISVVAPSHATLTTFAYGYAKPGGDTDLPPAITEQGSTGNVSVAQGFDQLYRLTTWLVQSGTPSCAATPTSSTAPRTERG